jgi:DNA-binding transcriptional regulator YiaG
VSTPRTPRGGIRTVEDIRQRCRIDPFTECWIWGLAHRDNGGAYMSVIHPVTGKASATHGRRAALLLASGADLPAGVYCYAGPDCRHFDCCNPAHARYSTRAEYGAWQRDSGQLKGKVARVKSAQATAMAQRKLTPEQVNAIRSSLVSDAKLAATYGVCRKTINNVRNGSRYRNDAPAFNSSSVFAWRPE